MLLRLNFEANYWLSHKQIIFENIKKTLFLVSMIASRESTPTTDTSFFEADASFSVSEPPKDQSDTENNLADLSWDSSFEDSISKCSVPPMALFKDIVFPESDDSDMSWAPDFVRPENLNRPASPCLSVSTYFSTSSSLTISGNKKFKSFLQIQFLF